MSVKITYFKGYKLPTKVTITINDISVKCYFRYLSNDNYNGFFTPINTRQHNHYWLIRNLESELPVLFKIHQRIILDEAWERKTTCYWPVGTLEEQMKLFKLIDEVQKEF